MDATGVLVIWAGALGSMTADVAADMELVAVGAGVVVVVGDGVDVQDFAVAVLLAINSTAVFVARIATTVCWR